MGEETQPVLYDATDEGVGFIRLNRPDVHNAFNSDMTVRLIELIDELKGADGVRCVFIEGVGKSFSAGADLHSMKRAGEMTHLENIEDAKRFSSMLKSLRDLPMPTIALVNGAAMGGGVGLVAACDIAVAAHGAFFAFSEAKLGLIPAMISPYVIEAIGPRQARRYFTTAERFGAEEALRLGLVHEVVKDVTDLMKVSERLAGSILANAPGAVQAAKELIDSVVWREFDKHMISNTSKRIADRRATDEAQEGMAAFLEKRKPKWAK
jgi:methylglutaconyl-CoA hydratase